MCENCKQVATKEVDINGVKHPVRVMSCRVATDEDPSFMHLSKFTGHVVERADAQDLRPIPQAPGPESKDLKYGSQALR